MRLIKSFYEVKTGQRITYELTALISCPAATDQTFPAWKSHWDEMARYQRYPAAPAQLQDIFYERIASSGELKA